MRQHVLADLNGVGVWGGYQLFTTVGVGGPAVSKTAKYFFLLLDYHKLSLTLSQGQTSTKYCVWTFQRSRASDRINVAMNLKDGKFVFQECVLQL